MTPDESVRIRDLLWTALAVVAIYVVLVGLLATGPG